MTPRDWQSIQNEYIHDRSCTYTSLAEKYNVPYRTLRWYARKELWREERFRYCHLVAEKLSERTAAAALPTIRAGRLGRSPKNPCSGLAQEAPPSLLAHRGKCGLARIS